MPTYEYACTACGHRLDAVQSFTDDPLSICPECDGALRKVYGAVGIAFKGSGFYKTDSRVTSSASNGEAKKSDEATPVSSESKSDSTTTTKADSPKPSPDGGSGTSTPKESKPAASTAS
ncbi:MAG TPA: FmdB family zinc ribbon protein [Acidimicrobiales bacterium]|nr:FmdB family zinc ribbon protein [Acidimicrobiales bacterium]